MKETWLKNLSALRPSFILCCKCINQDNVEVYIEEAFCISKAGHVLFVTAQVLSTPTTSADHFLPWYPPVTLPTLLSEDWTAQASPTALAWCHSFSLPPKPPHISPLLSLSISLSCLFCLCPSPLFLFFSNKNNRLWNAFSCGITHRHQPPHAIRLSRGRGAFSGGALPACHLVVWRRNSIYKETDSEKEIGVHELGTRWQISVQFVESRTEY